MRLAKVIFNRHSNARFTCCNCGGITYDNAGPVYADLEGEPFRAFYCDGCAAPLLAKQADDPAPA